MAEKHRHDAPWVREYRDSVWTDGTVAKRDYFDEKGRPRYRIYVNAHGRPYLASWVNENGYEYRTVEYTSTSSYLRGDMRGANTAWLRNRLESLGPAVLYTDEPRTTFALTLSTENVKHVTAIHTTHRQNNQNGSAGMKHWVEHYKQNFSRVRNLIFFTEAQRLEFIADTGCPESITTCIPHPAPLEKATKVVESKSLVRDTRKIVSISRLASDKRVSDVIVAFSRVREECPAAKLQIFGLGPEEPTLRKLVRDLNLCSQVSFEGYTPEPLDHFAESAASIMTSSYEGFGLVLIESMAVGTPVIAYSVNYGPREVVKSDFNGYLCDDGDVEALADAMLKVLRSNRSDFLRLQKGALKTARKFSRDNWRDKWARTFSEAEKEMCSKG